MSVRKTTHLTNARAIELTGDGVSAAVKRVGKDALAKAADVERRTIEKWMAQGSLPAIDCLLNMADQDQSVLNGLLAEKGWASLTRAVASPANDMQLASHLGHSLAELIERLRDGRRCHIDTAVLAALFRQIIPEMQAIVDEDDEQRKRRA